MNSPSFEEKLLVKFFKKEELNELCIYSTRMGTTNSYRQQFNTKKHNFEAYIKKLQEKVEIFNIEVNNISIDHTNIKILTQSRNNQKNNNTAKPFIINYNDDTDPKINKNMEDINYVLGGWKHICFFQQDIGNVKTLVQFYFNLIHCYNKYKTNTKTKKFYCSLPKEWKDIITHTKIKPNIKNELTMLGVETKFHGGSSKVPLRNDIYEFVKNLSNKLYSSDNIWKNSFIRLLTKVLCIIQISIDKIRSIGMIGPTPFGSPGITVISAKNKQKKNLQVGDIFNRMDYLTDTHKTGKVIKILNTTDLSNSERNIIKREIGRYNKVAYRINEDVNNEDVISGHKKVRWAKSTKSRHARSIDIIGPTPSGSPAKSGRPVPANHNSSSVGGATNSTGDAISYAKIRYHNIECDSGMVNTATRCEELKDTEGLRRCKYKLGEGCKKIEQNGDNETKIRKKRIAATLQVSRNYLNNINIATKSLNAISKEVEKKIKNKRMNEVRKEINPPKISKTPSGKSTRGSPHSKTTPTGKKSSTITQNATNLQSIGASAKLGNISIYDLPAFNEKLQKFISKDISMANDELDDLLNIEIRDGSSTETLLEYISRNLSKPTAITNITLIKDRQPYTWYKNKGIPDPEYETLNKLSKIIGVKSSYDDIGYNCGGVIPLTYEEDEGKIRTAVEQKLENIKNKLIKKINSLPSNVEHIIKKYCTHKDKDSVKKSKRAIIDIFDNYIKNVSIENTNKTKVYKKNIINGVIGLFKTFHRQTYPLYYKYTVLKEERKTYNKEKQYHYSDDKKEHFLMNIKITEKMNDVDQEIIKLRQNIIKKLNSTLLIVVHLLLKIEYLINQLKTVNKSVRKEFNEIFNIELTKKIIKMLSKKSGDSSLIKLKNDIIKQSTKYLPSFDFDRFFTTTFPDPNKITTNALVNFLVNNKPYIQDKLNNKFSSQDELLSNSNNTEIIINEVGIWIPAIIHAPVKINRKLINRIRGVTSKIRSKLILYNLFTGEIIPCLSRFKGFSQKNIKEYGESCFDITQIYNNRSLIQYNITPENFKGTIVMGPKKSTIYKYMQLFADKLNMMDKVRINIDNILEIRDNNIFNEWISSNLILFLDYYVKDEMYETSDKKMQIAIEYGKNPEVVKIRQIFGNKKINTNKLVKPRNNKLSEPQLNKNLSMERTIKKWAYKGKGNKKQDEIETKIGDLYKDSVISYNKGFQGITGIKVKKMCVEIYKGYLDDEGLTINDFNKIMKYMKRDMNSADHNIIIQGGSKKKKILNKDIRKEEKMIEKMGNHIMENIKKQTALFNID
jgi:hypothetical protein